MSSRLTSVASSFPRSESRDARVALLWASGSYVPEKNAYLTEPHTSTYTKPHPTLPGVGRDKEIQSL